MASSTSAPIASSFDTLPILITVLKARKLACDGRCCHLKSPRSPCSCLGRGSTRIASHKPRFQLGGTVCERPQLRGANLLGVRADRSFRRFRRLLGLLRRCAADRPVGGVSARMAARPVASSNSYRTYEVHPRIRSQTLVRSGSAPQKRLDGEKTMAV